MKGEVVSSKGDGVWKDSVREVIRDDGMRVMLCTRWDVVGGRTW